MPDNPKTYQQLQPEERVSLASWRQPGLSVGHMAAKLGRSPATISRELRRNAAPEGYTSAAAQATRPRKGLGVRAPLAVYREWLINSPDHSTLVH